MNLDIPDQSCEILASSHAPSAVVYVSSHEGCNKTDVYWTVSHNSTMSRKLDDLDGAGLMDQTFDGRGYLLSLTVEGVEVAGHLSAIEGLLEQDLRRNR